MVIKKPKKSTSTEGVKEKCVEKFIEWWPDDILLRQLINQIVPKKDTLRLFNINEITNVEKLAGILFDLVGPNFLSEIYGDRYKTYTKQFRLLCLNAAIKNGQITEEEILDKSNQVGIRGINYNYDTLENVSDATISSKWNYKWGLELTKFLDLPTSVVESLPGEKPGAKMETVEANLDIKPLHDYQIAGSQHIMRMLTEEDFTKKTLIAIPTGAGKTRLVVETLVDWLNSRKQDSPEQQKNSKFIIWLAHSHELCEQAIDAFKQIYHAKGKTALNIHRFFGAGGELPAGTEFEDLLPENGVIVATISSFYKILPKLKKKVSVDQVDDEKTNDEFQEFDEGSPLEPLAKITSCIVIDEAHRSLASSYTAFLRAMGLSFRGKGRNDHNIALVGLTATPFRGSGRDQFDNQELGVETKRLRKRYGGEPFVPFIHSHSTQSKPTAIIDCPDEVILGDPVRINGDRSFDNEGIITNYDWSIELVGEENESLPNVKPEKTIYQNFSKEGKYWIKLKVTNSYENFDEAEKEIHVIKVESEIPMDDFGKQKALYKTLTDRNILCKVLSGKIRGANIRIRDDKTIQATNLKGEIQKKTLGEIADDYRRNRTILNTINNLHSKYDRKRILFFACNIPHAREIAIVLKAKYDIKAAYLDSTIPIGRRIQIINQFKNGEISVLCNVDILTTGFDVPEIDCVFVGRPAKSTVLFTQMIGRGMRGTRMGGTPDMWLINTNDQIQLSYYQGAIPLGWQTFEPFWHQLPSNLDLELLPTETKRSSDVSPETYDKWHAETVERPIPEPISEPVEETKPKVVEHTCLKCGTTATGIVEIRDVFGFEAPDRLIIEQLAKDEHGQIPKKCQKCRDAEREPKEIEVEVAQTPKQDEWIEYISTQKNFQGNYQMVLGLYFVRCQRYQSDADLESARQFLAKHNPGKSVAFFYKHAVFDVYSKRGLITIDQTSSEIDFKKILDLNGFEQLCYEKLEELESEKSMPVTSTENLTDKQTKEKLDSHYESCKGIFGHIPTTRQFKESTRPEWLDLMERLYGSYNKFLDSKNESLETDQDLKDILYYEYYDLFYIKHGTVTKEDLHAHGKYRIDDYEDAFGSFDDFLQIISNIDKRVMKLFEEPVPDSELEDFLEKLDEDRKVIKEAYGRVPHFDEIRTESKIGVEHYIAHGYFQSATLQRFHDVIDTTSGFGRTYVKSKSRIWIWSVTPENWKILNEKEIWASKKPIEKISQKVSPGDKVIFYVIGTHEFQGIFEFDGKWYTAPSPVWSDEMDNVIYQSQIKVKQLVLGHVNVYGIAPKLQVFPSSDKRLINLVLKGGGGYPSNGGKPISAEDYTKISEALKPV